MFGTTKTPARSALLPTQALRLFNFYMEGTRTMNDDKGILTELCLDAGSVLARIQQPARKALASLSSASSASNGDMALRQGIALAYHELARLFEHLGYSGEVHRYDRKAEKWGYIQGSSNNNSDNSGSGNNTNSSEEESTRTSGSRTEAVPAQFIATISKDIFNHDEPPTMVRHSLPEPGAHLNNIHQLTYCLSLLPTIPVLPNDLNENERKWRQALSNDQDECKRLHKLAWDVIGLFASDEIKTEATIAEVVSLAPALDQDQFRTLLMALVNGIGRNMILKPHLLEGLAQLIQHAPPGYLDSDDLVLTLNTLSSRLRGTHTQSDDHLCRLSAAVSDVLDAMVSNQVKGLKREQLHEPLAIYLKELKANSDPYLVYQAAYAFQALQYVPDNESTVQAMLRRTSAVLRGVFGALGAVKSLDLKVFMDEISNIQKELPSVTGAIDMSLKVYTGATSLYEGGTTFRQCMEEGLSFSHKSAWYPALRGADALLQRGEFTKFKTLVCEAPCRNEAAFQWGLCQRLGWIAADTRWTINTRQDAITFLGEIYKNDQEWSDHEHVKQWIIHILSRLSSLSPDFLQGVCFILFCIYG
ncbi:hypothetical protein BX616_000480 [Lobosporangium transversale]|nr:hypothetical protein BX616_000480 [Lobosporangium transversale]